VAQVPETYYATNADGDRVAYQVVGDGPVDVLVNRPTLFPVDLMWDEPRLVHFLHRLSSFCRHIWFDPRGTGASDGITHGDVRLLEGITDDMVTVLDAVGVRRAALLGLGVASGVLFAATHPDRTTALVLYNATARFRRADDYPDGLSDREIERRLQVGPGVTNPGVASVEQIAPGLADDRRFRRWFDRAQRLTLGPHEAAWRLKGSYEIDVRDVLGAIQAPTLVVYRSSAERAALSRYLADHIEGAKRVELEGDDMFVFSGGSGGFLEATEEFLTGQKPRRSADRVLATLLFTDVVESTELLGRLGDRRWRELLVTHDALVREELDRFRGHEVKFTGDGFLSTFDGPARAVRCACAIRDALAALGLDLRAGLHTGEIEQHGDDLAGIAVHVAQRVMAQAQPGEVLVTRTVADLIGGSDIDLVDRGEHHLKGVTGAWRLFSVDA
jgi:class 3 adenylate cyclase/pimeloyl-ACP methyl ester carboxylesterase